MRRFPENPPRHEDRRKGRHRRQRAGNRRGTPRRHGGHLRRRRSRLYGLEILRRGIETNKHNFTRFLLLADERRAANSPIPPTPTKPRCSSPFRTPGSLSKVLTVLSFYDINLTKKYSRCPSSGASGEYRFYVDVTFDDPMRYRQAIDAARPLTSDFRILGEYAECPNPAI